MVAWLQGLCKTAQRVLLAQAQARSTSSPARDVLTCVLERGQYTQPKFRPQTCPQKAQAESCIRDLCQTRQLEKPAGSASKPVHHKDLSANVPGVASASTVASSCSQSASEQHSSSITKLLVANRGEIACRVMQTARRLGIPTVAVFSEADAGARHVAMADEAFCIGPPAAQDSYLRQDKILQVAKQTGCSAIHPGYGFLSENAEFARACAAAGVAFVGPPADAIQAMGDKSRAKAMMSAAQVPVVPGYHGQQQDASWLESQAAGIGFPLLVKAVAGGGGKGMKLAEDRQGFLSALASAKREAASAFGNDHVLLERYIGKPRHIEVQVFGDAHGSFVHLHERDCSVQRRHQKVIEEAPAPNISDSFRQALGEAAVAAARAVGYVNAGTVEFIVDTETGEYFFMEMNTRLQVEHPVTEMVTGLDLVEWQLRVAAGEKLPLTQAQIPKLGHAFEARLYAECPEKGFLPSPGTVRRWRVPTGATEFNNYGDVRVDSGVQEGDEVGANYDPLIAKVIAGGPDRETALGTLSSCLSQLQVGGLTTNQGFLQRLANHPAFRAAELDTDFIPRHLPSLACVSTPPVDTLALAALGLHHLAIQREASSQVQPLQQQQQGPWKADGFRINHALCCSSSFTVASVSMQADLMLTFERDGTIHIQGEGKSPTGSSQVDVVARHTSLDDDSLVTQLGDRLLRAEVLSHQHLDQQVLTLWVDGSCWQFLRPIPSAWQRAGTAAAVSGAVSTPMPGKIISVLVSQGGGVDQGQPLLVMEAMKMEHTVRAPCAGVVASLAARVGQQVADGHVLAVIQPDQEAATQAGMQGGGAQSAVQL